MDRSLPGSSVHGIFQARVLEWVAISFSRGSSQPRDRTGSPTLEADALPTEPPNLINLLEQLVSSSMLCSQESQLILSEVKVFFPNALNLCFLGNNLNLHGLKLRSFFPNPLNF